MPQKIYWLDQHDIIRKVDDYWDNTLEDPTAKRVRKSEILGKPLFEFICDDITRMFIRTLLQSARLLMQPLCRPYRCDSPTEKRYLQMTIALESDGLLSVAHELIKTEPLFKPVFFQTVSSSMANSQGGSHIRCSICNRVRLSRHISWQEVDSLAVIAEAKHPISVIYGVCSDCMSSLKSKTEKLAAF